MAKDTTKYNFNGKKNLTKRAIAKEIIEKYLAENTNKIYKELQTTFNQKKFGYGENIVLNEEDYLSWKKGKTDSNDRFFPPISFGNDKLYINNQWGIWNINPFIEMAKKEFKYDIEIIENNNR